MAESLIDQFRALGVNHPEGWARSQQDEGIDQLSRATVLRAFADMVARSTDLLEGAADANEPEVRAAFERIKASNAAETDVDTLVKSTIFNCLFDVLAFLDGAAIPERNPGNLEFGLFKLNDEEEPEEMVQALHESWREVASSVLGNHVVSA